MGAIVVLGEVRQSLFPDGMQEIFGCLHLINMFALKTKKSTGH